jgi:hypothetical protein
MMQYLRIATLFDQTKRCYRSRNLKKIISPAEKESQFGFLHGEKGFIFNMNKHDAIVKAKQVMEKARESIEEILKVSFIDVHIKVVLGSIDNVGKSLDYIEHIERPKVIVAPPPPSISLAPIIREQRVIVKEKRNPPPPIIREQRVIVREKALPKDRVVVEKKSVSPPSKKRERDNDILGENGLISLVDQLKKNETATKLLIEAYRGKSVHVSHFDKIPDPTTSVFGNMVEMQSYLSSDWDKEEQTPIEQIGVLVRWWKIVQKAFVISNIFKELKQRRDHTGKKKRKSLMDMYDIECEKIIQKFPESKLYSYTYARIYAELGEFLEKYPVLINQTIIVSLSEWRQRVAFDRQTPYLMDYISSVLDKEKPIKKRN